MMCWTMELWVSTEIVDDECELSNVNHALCKTEVGVGDLRSGSNSETLSTTTREILSQVASFQLNTSSDAMSKEKSQSPALGQSETGETEKKRKRAREEKDDDLEIDVNLPEPPSKKAKRKEKKAEKHKIKQPLPAPTTKDGATPISNSSSELHASTQAAAVKERSEFGIWIGNLPFSVSKDDLRQFLDREGGIAEEEIIRLHLPPPKDGSGRKGDQNRGFAYIDFTTQTILDKALRLTERLLSGRSVLIKNAKSFEGRPPKSSEGQPDAAKKEPSKRIFVGNLGFDVTREEIGEHFSQAGKVEDVFVASFEDSGKCKGFGWVRFAEIDAAEAAVRGFVYEEPRPKDDEAGGSQDGELKTAGDKSETKSKKEKRRKWFLNRLSGRELRCEFAEDAHTRYKKRYGKDAKSAKPANAPAIPTNDASIPIENDTRTRPSQHSHPVQTKLDRKGSMNQDERREERRKRHEKMDARKIAPGQAHSSTPRASGAIVAGVGKKTSFA